MAVDNAVKAGFEKQQFMTTLGADLTLGDGGLCEITLPFDDKLTQQHGLLHGGVIATLADNAAGFAAYSLMDEDYQPLTVEFKLNLLEPAVGQSALARANVLKAGRSIYHVKSEVFMIDNGKASCVAFALATIKATKAVGEIGI